MNLSLPDPTSAASSPCGRAGQATWKSRCEKMTLDLTTTQAEFELISRKARIWPCLDDRQVKWFYHAAETEGTAKGGGRVEDIKTPVGKLFVLLCWGHQKSDVIQRLFIFMCLLCVWVRSNVFLFILRTSILCCLQLCVFFFSLVYYCPEDIFVVLFIICVCLFVHVH